MSINNETRPPVPPFSTETAIEKVHFACEWHDEQNYWYRSYGKDWEFNAVGLMQVRHASINDLAIEEFERLFRWPLGRRPDDHPGLSEFGLQVTLNNRTQPRGSPKEKDHEQHKTV